MHDGCVRMEFPDRVPPSLNVVGGRPHPGAWRRFKTLWGDFFTEQLVAAQARGDLPREQVDFVEAAGICRFNTERPRDEGNFRTPLEKALGDALVGQRTAWPEGRWLPDDTSQHYTFRGLAIVVDTTKRPLTVVEFNWSKARLV